MKNLKIMMVALALLALPAAVFGQVVSECPMSTCTHEVSVFMGEGGLVATTDAKKVTWYTTCSGVTRSGELTPNDDGMVAALFTMDNSRACASPDEDDVFQIGPIDDSGWYWITDDMNSAVGSLVARDTLENKNVVSPTSAGDGVTMTPGTGAVYLKETATGRVGILPTILPEPPADRCGKDTAGKKPDNNCMLDAEYAIVATTGTGVDLKSVGSTITRDATAAIVVDLSVGGEGFLEAGDSQAATWSIGGENGLSTPGVTPTNATFSVAPKTDGRCAGDNKATPVKVVVQLTATTGYVPNAAASDKITQTFSVQCSAPAAPSLGVELVPDNPFPTDK